MSLDDQMGSAMAFDALLVKWGGERKQCICPVLFGIFLRRVDCRSVLSNPFSVASIRSISIRLSTVSW